MLPAPNHLTSCTTPLPERSGEHQYVGHVKCSCQCDELKIHYTGGTHKINGETIPCVTKIGEEYYLRIAAQCTACGIEHLLFDMDFHGWEGVVCHDKAKAQRLRPPLVPWACRVCGTEQFHADVAISGEDVECAVEESEGELDATNWQEGFGWIDIQLHCVACSDTHTSWISYETM